ncbi:hypothetical protein CWB99_17940 [Pseudoalteromonas rubra]|uniref:Uncharacterized protein n=1 Tax=Pseudoalteromonas rubra TaxID=43658 RepID=A0A5S3WI21_9GAMM|nr:hypothetical protein [Pseudoalteromonas rubra]TMP26740.1 hypothetical protein CWB99_17940 [Pseudoalteromonas rubra]TMP30713.1 hypothetical protein CWC00_16170 [Pseudoalteromonas rubra]
MQGLNAAILVLSAVSVPAWAKQVVVEVPVGFSFNAQGHTFYVDMLHTNYKVLPFKLRFWSDCTQACDKRQVQRAIVREFEAQLRSDTINALPSRTWSCEDTSGCEYRGKQIRVLFDTLFSVEQFSRFDLPVFDLRLSYNRQDSGILMPNGAFNVDEGHNFLINENFVFTQLGPSTFQVHYKTDRNDIDQQEDEQQLLAHVEKMAYQCTEQVSGALPELEVTLTCHHNAQ